MCGHTPPEAELQSQAGVVSKAGAHVGMKKSKGKGKGVPKAIAAAIVVLPGMQKLPGKGKRSGQSPRACRKAGRARTSLLRRQRNRYLERGRRQPWKAGACRPERRRAEFAGTGRMQP